MNETYTCIVLNFIRNERKHLDNEPIQRLIEWFRFGCAEELNINWTETISDCGFRVPVSSRIDSGCRVIGIKKHSWVRANTLLANVSKRRWVENVVEIASKCFSNRIESERNDDYWHLFWYGKFLRNRKEKEFQCQNYISICRWKTRRLNNICVVTNTMSEHECFLNG